MSDIVLPPVEPVDVPAETVERPAPVQRGRKKLAPELKAERAKLRDARVEFVADMMRQLIYRNGVHTRALKEAWNLPQAHIADIVVTASRIVRSELGDTDRVLSKVTAALDRVIDEAIAVGDRHAVIQAARAYAQVSGAGAATRIEVSGDLSNLTPDQIRAKKAEILARLRGDPATADAIDVPADAPVALLEPSSE